MKNRTDEIWASLSSLIEERNIQDIKQASLAAESHADAALNELRSALRSCNEQSLLLRSQGEKGNTRFITLSFLDSGILTGSYDLRIDFYDDRFLSDIAEACAYFSYRHLVPIYQESAGVICREAGKDFTRLMDYEKDALAWRYKDEVLYKMVMSASLFYLLHSDMTDFWRELTVSEDCVFTFGKFLRGQRPYLKFLPAGGLEAI
ncbi:hypothetical protein FACS1894171_0890 [Clostridia bacterium]|nr:hypothetical protein FACS1894171_0890 [Clostridia bacterium]